MLNLVVTHRLQWSSVHRKSQEILLTPHCLLRNCPLSSPTWAMPRVQGLCHDAFGGQRDESKELSHISETKIENWWPTPLPNADLSVHFLHAIVLCVLMVHLTVQGVPGPLLRCTSSLIPSHGWQEEELCLMLSSWFWALHKQRRTDQKS